MSNFKISFWIIMALLFLPLNGFTQQHYTIVYDLYYQLILSPETGDQFIAINASHFNSQFYSCLSSVRQRALNEARQHNVICNQHADPHWRAQCESNNEGAKFYRWTDEIEPVCRGSNLWSNTPTGQAAIITKRNLDSMNPGQWERIIRSTAPSIRLALICN